MSHHYSRRVLPVLLPLFALALLAGGCGGGEKPEPKEALLAEWAAMAKADAATLDPAKAEQLGLRLAKHGPEALNPIVDTLAGPGANPVAQMLGVARRTCWARWRRGERRPPPWRHGCGN